VLLVGAVGRVKTAKNCCSLSAPTECPRLGSLRRSRNRESRPIRNDVVLVCVVRHLDTVGALRKQIDGRGAEQREVRCVDDALEHRLPRLHRITSSSSFESTRLTIGARAGQLEKTEPLRKTQSIPVSGDSPETSVNVTGSSAPESAKPTGRTDVAGRNSCHRDAPFVAARAHPGRRPGITRAVGSPTSSRSRQIETQPVDGRLRELEAGGGPQSNSDTALDTLGDR